LHPRDREKGSFLKNGLFLFLALIVFGRDLGSQEKTASAKKSFFGGPPSLWAANAPPEVKAVLDKVEEAQSTVKDVQMDLRMEVKDNVSDQKQSVRGQVKMKSPDKVYATTPNPPNSFSISTATP
jgi:hypothetical protein